MGFRSQAQCLSPLEEVRQRPTLPSTEPGPPQSGKASTPSSRDTQQQQKKRKKKKVYVCFRCF